MRPDTPLGALALMVHADTYEDHDPHDCPLNSCDRCHWFATHDVPQAQRYLELLEGMRWHLAADLSLPEVAPSGKRETSRKAAASIHDLRGGMKGVYELVACHGSNGLTDFEIDAQYTGFALHNGFPRLAPDSPRKRRHDLSGAGHLMDSGRTRPNPETWCEAIVWVARDAERAAA